MATNASVEWKLPTVPKHKIFKQKWFNFFSYNKTKTHSRTLTIPYEGSTLNVFGNVWNNEEFRHVFTEHMFSHIGLVQIGVKPLTRQSPQCSIVVSLHDKRVLDFKTSLLGLVESNFNDGPFYFNVFPNLMVPYEDMFNEHVLRVNSKIKGGYQVKKSVLGHLVLSFRVSYRPVHSPYADTALKESSIGETTLILLNVKSESKDSKSKPSDSKLIKWEDVEIPSNWLETPHQ